MLKGDEGARCNKKSNTHFGRHAHEDKTYIEASVFVYLSRILSLRAEPAELLGEH